MSGNKKERSLYICVFKRLVEGYWNTTCRLIDAKSEAGARAVFFKKVFCEGDESYKECAKFYCQNKKEGQRLTIVDFYTGMPEWSGGVLDFSCEEVKASTKLVAKGDEHSNAVALFKELDDKDFSKDKKVVLHEEIDDEESANESDDEFVANSEDESDEEEAEEEDELDKAERILKEEAELEKKRKRQTTEKNTPKKLTRVKRVISDDPDE